MKSFYSNMSTQQQRYLMCAAPPALLILADIAFFVFCTIVTKGNTGSLEFLLQIGAVCAVFWMLPSLIAAYRNHPQFMAIWAINVVGAWFVGIGWLVALIWSLVNPAQTAVISLPQQAPPPLPTPSDPLDALERLARLRSSGILSESEFTEQKDLILRRRKG